LWGGEQSSPRSIPDPSTEESGTTSISSFEYVLPWYQFSKKIIKYKNIVICIFWGSKLMSREERFILRRPNSTIDQTIIGLVGISHGAHTSYSSSQSSSKTVKTMYHFFVESILLQHSNGLVHRAA
jgi:hypothetical protein